MLTAVAVLIDGLVYASWLFIVAVGLTVTFGVMRILNVTHGSLYAFGAYAAAWAVGLYFERGYPPLGSFAVLLAAAIAVGLVLGLVIERGLLRRLYGRDEVVLVLVTYGAFLVLEDVAILVFGVDPYFAFQPYALLGMTGVGGLVFTNYDLALVGAAAALGGLSWWSLVGTRWGKLVSAVIHDREMSLAVGIDVPVVYTATFVAGAVLGALGGALTAPVISVTPGIGVEVIVLAFAVVVIGGMASVPGAMVGALVVGLCHAAAVHLLPEAELFVIYGVMSAVLAVRPQGLFARAAARRI